MGYTVSVDLAAHGPITEDELHTVAAIGGAATGWPGRTALGTTMGVEAPDMGDAVSRALEQVAAIIPITPIWVEVMTFEEQDRRLEEPLYPEMVGPDEVAERFDMTRDEAVALADADGYPIPVAVLATGPIWVRWQIEGVLQGRARERGST